MLAVTGRDSPGCFSCTNYLRCKDSRKSFLYRCSRFTQNEQSDKQSGQLFAELLEVESEFDPENYGPAEIYTGAPSKSENFDIYSVIEGVIRENALAPPDLKINDREWPEAKNFFEFCVNDKFLRVKPYIMQVAIATITLAEYCPCCSNTDYLFNKIRATDSYGKFKKYVVLLEHGICPVCAKDRRKLVRKHDLKFYDELAASAGQRAGKSALVAMMSAYILHRMLKLQNPNEVYGLMSSNVLHGTFVALTFGQAKENLWDPFYGNILESPWFQGYHQNLLEFSRKRGDELVKLKDNFINYKHRRLLMYPASPDKRILRGRTRFLGSIDEIGWMNNDASTKKIKANANETYAALGNSLRTIRSKAERLLRQGFFNVPTGYFLNISSPSSARDKIMDLVKKSQGSKKTYGILKPTWELNPDVTRESLAEDFRRDPVVAMRDFGAQPPLSSNPFIGNPQTVLSCMGDKKNFIEIAYARKRSPDGSLKRFAKLIRVKPSGMPSVMAIDAGYSNNSFALSIGHKRDGVPQIDLLVEVQPLPGMPLSYRAIYDHLIKPLIEQRNVQVVAADRWNSLKLLSDIEEDFDVVTIQHSLKYAEMQLFKEYVEDKEVIFPCLPKGESIDTVLAYNADEYPKCFAYNPVGHFLLQLVTVQDTGSSVIKGEQLTDDLARASMLAVSLLLNEDFQMFWDKPIAESTKFFDVKQMAISRGASTGVFGGSGTSGSSSMVIGRVISRSNS